MNSSSIMNIFVSSVQKEFAEERKAIKAFVSGDSLLRRLFHVFLFEDLPAEDRRGGTGAASNAAQVTAQVVDVLSAATVSPKTHEELSSVAGIEHREHFRKAYIKFVTF
jgi:hypothetical protein